LSCNGYKKPTTPHIDALAAKSVNFTRCLTPIASTVESITSIMTSQYPHTHGLQHMFPNRDQVERMRQNSPSVAALLKQSGYETAVVGDWCGGVFDLLHLGIDAKDRDVSTFDNFKVYLTQAVYQEHPVLPLFFDNALGYSLFPNLKSCASFVTPEVATERLKDRLSDAANRNKPFFITAFYSITHLPYSINPPYDTKFTNPQYQGPHRGRMDLNIGEFIGNVDIANKWRQMPKEEVDQIVGLYDGCIAKFDDTVKSVLDHLKKTGLAENTVVVVTADHGDDHFEPNCTFGHGLTFNGGDQNTHIPCVWHIPGTTDTGKPRQIDKLVRSIDFAPTLLELAGLAKDARMEGRSLMPYVNGTAKDLGLAYYGETSYLFCKRYIPGEEPLYIPAMDETTEVDEKFDCHMVLKPKFQDTVIATKERCLRTQDWKLVFTPGQHHEIWRLFHLPTDPHCENPVQLENPATFQVMKAALAKWMQQKQEQQIPEIFPQGEPAKAPLAAATTP
jgi:arylsulfatase A-like enzyme